MEIQKIGKIYQIKSPNTNQKYIGSTFGPLIKRFSIHKSSSNKTSSSEIIKMGGAYIELISQHENLTTNELRKFEGECIRATDCVNKVIAGRSAKERYNDNKDKIKAYYEENKDKIKAYYEENKDKIKDNIKAYYEENKDMINKKRRQHFVCECGGRFTLPNKATHLQTIKTKLFANK